MKFITKEEQEKPPVVITMKVEQYYGCRLPTLYANDIPILHILEDGRICIRSEESTNILELERLGFSLIQRELEVIRSTNLHRKEK